jgi:NADH:ubiquinone oxidoreductase subunit E
MPNPKQLIHPDISPDMLSEINTIVDAHKSEKGAVIPVLRLCQDVVGYLPVELIDYISAGLLLPKSDVLGVATF